MASNTSVSLSQIGLLSNLKTNDKSNIVNAINELKADIDNVQVYNIGGFTLASTEYANTGNTNESFVVPGPGLCTYSGFSYIQGYITGDAVACELYVNGILKDQRNINSSYLYGYRGTLCESGKRAFTVKKGDVIKAVTAASGTATCFFSFMMATVFYIPS